MLIHVVKAGETITSIAASYGVDPERLRTDNGVGPEGALAVGQTLVVRFPKMVHVVRRGETLASIAGDYGVTPRQLWRRNYQLAGSSSLSPGQVLVISYEESSLGTIGTSGYAYPSISRPQLQAALPYLTWLIPFTYGITAEGNLLELDVGDLPVQASERGTGTLLHLSSMTEEGQFSNQRSGLILTDPDLAKRLLDQAEAEVLRRGYRGVDVDFEFIPADQSQAYADFVAAMARRMHPLGRFVMTALAPKVRRDQPGLLYEGHDYAALGMAADLLLAMTYEWGYTYGPPMAVAPLPNVRQVLDYAVAEIPAKKIFLGVPTYGYDWPLPFEEGVTRVRSLSAGEAISLAIQYNIAIQYDEEAQSPYFYYTAEDGIVHAVWFEDARSIEKKLLLIREYGLSGTGFWNLMRPFPQGWAVLDSLYNIAEN